MSDYADRPSLAHRLAVARQALANYSAMAAHAEQAHADAIAARCAPFDIDRLGEQAGDLLTIAGKLKRYVAALEKETAGE